MKRFFLPAAAALAFVSAPVFAEGPTPEPTTAVDAAEDAPSAEEEEAAGVGEELSEAERFAILKKELGAIEGPFKGAKIGNIATIDVPEGSWFVPKSGTAKFDELMENIHDSQSAGVLVSGHLDSAVYFTWEAIGYVKDDEDDLDADDLMETLQEQTVSGNAERRRLGYGEIELMGWVKAPFYNETNQSLEWATKFREKGSDGTGTSNYNTRRLGRAGVMSVVLASDPDKVEAELTRLNAQMKTFAFTPGEDYASFKEGDRIAEIGLGALVVGGGAVALAKLGFFAKFWKVLAGIGVAIAAGIAKLFGRKSKTEASHNDGAGEG